MSDGTTIELLMYLFFYLLIYATIISVYFFKRKKLYDLTKWGIVGEGELFYFQDTYTSQIINLLKNIQKSYLKDELKIDFCAEHDNIEEIIKEFQNYLAVLYFTDKIKHVKKMGCVSMAMAELLVFLGYNKDNKELLHKRIVDKCGALTEYGILYYKLLNLTYYYAENSIIKDYYVPSFSHENLEMTIIDACEHINNIGTFITGYNERSNFKITDIWKGDTRTIYFGYSNECRLEIIISNDNPADSFCLKINGGREVADKTSMFEVFKESIKVFDSSITEEMANSIAHDLDEKDVFVENYKIGESLMISYVPTKELSYGKNDCRIEISALDYK